MRILAIIPARGGSKGIPKKNIRLMHGKPLIYYAIQTVQKSKRDIDLFVSTDSPEIAEVAARYGSNIIMRGDSLSGDAVTLDPVIYHGMVTAEKQRGYTYDVIITLQPTSPLLTTETLDSAIDYFFQEESDTVISVVNQPHLAWGRDGEAVFPLYDERRNRQELPPHYLETGAFVIARRQVVQEHSRIGQAVSVFEVPGKESIDIDDYNDWILAEGLMNRKTIILRADGYIHLGLGHIYNCITLAYSLMEHDILILTRADAEPGIKKLMESNLPFKIFHDNSELEKICEEFRPDIWVNDCLDTTREYILHLKKMVPRVISIEDLGTGISAADAVINALYPDEVQQRNVFSGYKYVCLRDEFQLEDPTPFSPLVHNVIIMFGGTDPANMNRLVYDSVLQYQEETDSQIKFTFIIGIGYDNVMNGVVTNCDKNIFVQPNVPRVTTYMREADLAVTSQGRTIFEMAAMGVPTIVLSQNKREMTHSFARMEHGFLNLGLGKNVDCETIKNTIDWLIHTPAVRKNMHDLMVSCPLKAGLQRVKSIILGENEDND